jgi:hypothetical protein
MLPEELRGTAIFLKERLRFSAAPPADCDRRSRIGLLFLFLLKTTPFHDGPICGLVRQFDPESHLAPFGTDQQPRSTVGNLPGAGDYAVVGLPGIKMTIGGDGNFGLAIVRGAAPGPLPTNDTVVAPPQMGGTIRDA